MTDLQQHIRSVERKNEAKDAMVKLIDTTNVMGGEKDVAAGLLEALLSSHRTLQQSFFRAFADAMEHYAETPFVDLRNEASVEFAKKVKELDHYFPFV